ncbi:MAG: glycosyltransferase [Nocardioides sp.]|nr:glycosyltransferase [Nocardioides sp.]
MAQLVLATLDAGGNVPPVLTIGRDLQSSGHGVHVIGHPAQRDQVEVAGLAFTPYTHARPWSPTAEKSTLGGLRDFVGVFNDRGAGGDVVDLARRVRADAVGIDCMLLGVLAAVQAAQVPSAALFHTFHAYFDGPWRRGPVGLLSRLHGHHARRLWAGVDLGLVLTEAGLDPASPGAEAALVWTGAVVDTEAPALETPRPRVLVSLSTTAFPGMATTLQRILDALADLPVEAVVTTGPAIDPASLRAASNTAVHRVVDHAELMPTCSLVVSHGGHATSLRALAHGLPLLVIPAHPMLDQTMVGEAVARAGAGTVLPRSSSPDRIRDAVTRLLDTPSYRTAAASLGTQIRAGQGSRTAANALLGLVERAPH